MQQSRQRIEENARSLPTHYQVESGRTYPLGSTPDAHGVNFSIFAERATGVDLLLFEKPDDPEPMRIISLDPMIHKTFNFWHVYVRGLAPPVSYAYRVEGWQDLSGHGDRYNRNKVLIDPYARGNTDLLWNRVDGCSSGDNLATSMRSIVLDTTSYDWEGDRPLNRPMSETIIYELHVRGFTKSPSSGCQAAGTFAGVIEKIPYLKALGITAIELQPIFDFDHSDVLRLSPVDGTPLRNYWGYDPISFFALEQSYCMSQDAASQIREFRDMVKALHKAGLEVLLDVVFNHTSEGNEKGPTISFKGLANSNYYILSSQDRQFYMNFTGCGNTVNGNHPIMQKVIIDSLEYWVEEMHVDGFRFDEAVILCRDENGIPILHPPVVWQIELSEILAETKVIAEAWDAAGLYQVGYFPGYRWGEWNGRYRDVLRRFTRGDQGYIEEKTIVGRVADVIAGSADIFEANNLLPANSINFLTAHDGFTLNDLVSYNYKHNEANGEDNRDGIDSNLSWNCGVEGPTDDPGVEALRTRQIKNFAAILLLSQGVPMLVAGDEIRRTQRGNNNAYCQDNETSWFDWTLVERHRDLYRFFQRMIDFRKRHPLLRRGHFFTGQINERGLADISWHGCRLYCPGWHDPASRVLSFTLGGSQNGETGDDTDIHVILNMENEELSFDLPQLLNRSWYTFVDTALPSPLDIAEEDSENKVHGKVCPVQSHSVVVLISRP